MKIKPTDAKSSKPNKEMTHRSAGMGRSRSFSDTLNDSEVERRRQACDRILKQIETEAEELKKSLSPEGVKRYRKLVSAFMKEALSQSYELNQENHWDQSGNRKTFVTVKKVNQVLEEMMDAVVNKEKRQIDLVAKLDEIRGLLIDLYL